VVSFIVSIYPIHPFVQPLRWQSLGIQSGLPVRDGSTRGSEMTNRSSAKIPRLTFGPVSPYMEQERLFIDDCLFFRQYIAAIRNGFDRYPGSRK
jgi:hypothetical protein